MNSDERRNNIFRLISTSAQPITGSLLASKFGVTRQVIVQDIALLRAEGQSIIATPQGYMLPQAVSTSTSAKRSFVLNHGPDPKVIELELNTIVDLGGRILDVVVEHPVYGDLTGSLMIRSRREVQSFLHQLTSSNAEPLLVLREGVHLHTVEAPSEADLNIIRDELARLGLLLER